MAGSKPALQPTLRSLYRRLLRELPSKPPSLLANQSPIQHTIRSRFTTPLVSSSDQSHETADQADIDATIHSAEQFVQYLRAQRMYTTLVERYNPGVNMNEEEKVRLTARRVGMDLPVEVGDGVGGRGRGEE